MYKSVFSKYLTVISLVVVLGFLAMTVLQVFLTTNAFARDKRVLLTENATALSRQAALTGTNTQVNGGEMRYFVNPDAIRPMMNVLSSAIDATVVLTDAKGNILLSAGSERETLNADKVNLILLAPRLQNDFYEVGTLGGLYDSSHYTAGVPIQLNEGGQALGYVFASSPADALMQTIRDNMSIYAFSVLGAMALCLCLVFWMTDRFVSPLRQMAAATRRFAQGDFRARVKVKGKDEVAELGEALNSMAVSLSSVEMMRRSFIANVSHELRTPMTSIAGFLDGMLDGTIPEEKQAYYMKIVSDEVKRLSRLVQSMLNLSRIDSGELKMNVVHLDLTEVMCKVLVASEQRIDQKNLHITGIDQCEKLEIQGDYDLMNQVLYNLLDNAIKFTNEGGYIDIRLQKEKDRAVFVIRNTGAGIPAEEMPQIFERFYKSDRSRGLDKNGIGLGLYIVQTVVSLHGGQVSVRSVEGEFTEFRFWIPSEG